MEVTLLGTIIYRGELILDHRHIRKKCVEKLGIDYEKEFKFIEKVFPSNEKNYQLWFFLIIHVYVAYKY